MNQSRIEIVLFDVGNVIVRATQEITTAILRDLGVPYPMAVRFYANDDYRAFARGKITGETFAARMRALLGRTLTHEQIRDAHDAHLYAADEAVIDILRALHKRNVRLAFATDTNAWQTARERELIYLEPYGRAFRSHELGKLKADGGVFERIVTELGVDPERILFVDDSPEKIATAREIGMVTHRFTNAAALREELVRLGLLC